MGIPKGTKIIVNADVDIRDVIPGKTYVTQGGLPDLPGATIVKESKTFGYLERNQFVIEGETNEHPSTTEPSKAPVGVDKYLIP